ncbi:Putative kinetochore protein SPC25, partial [Tolypocladium paradoxum]
ALQSGHDRSKQNHTTHSQQIFQFVHLNYAHHLSTPKMATAFEPSLSTSLSRPSMAPVGPSAADSLPSVNFGFDDLRDRMAKFSAKFDAFIEQGRKRVLEERNQFRMNVAELQEDQRMKKRDIEIVQVKTSTHRQTIEREEAETREMETAIASLASQRDNHLAARDTLKKQIAQTQAEIETRLAAQRAFTSQQEAQSRFNVPELDFWITNLCLKIEGAGQDDRLKFIYTHIDEKSWEREAWFELVTSSRDYDVKHCKPKLERDAVERVLDKVNESRELVVLLKGMRELFVEAMKT